MKKAIVAAGRPILVIIWYLLSDPVARFTDLGSDFYDKRIDPERRKRAHIHQLEALGYNVTIEPRGLINRFAPSRPATTLGFPGVNEGTLGNWVAKARGNGPVRPTALAQ